MKITDTTNLDIYKDSDGKWVVDIIEDNMVIERHRYGLLCRLLADINNDLNHASEEE